MRLHIDGIIFSLQQHGGITVYFRELLSRLALEHQATLTMELPLLHHVDPAAFPGVKCVLRPARRLERLRKVRRIGGSASDIFHSSYYRQPEQISQPTVVTVHDFVYQRFMHGPPAWLQNRRMTGAINQARHIICISEATRQDLYEFMPPRPDQRISVIHNGVSDLFRPLQTEGEAPPLPADPSCSLLGNAPVTRTSRWRFAPLKDWTTWSCAAWAVARCSLANWRASASQRADASAT